MAVCDITRIRKRVIELLVAGARASRYQDILGTNADYAALQEISDVILAIDFDICGDIVDDPDSPSGTAFMFPTASLTSGDFIPASEGARGNVELYDGSAWKAGLLAASEDEIAEMLASPSLYANAGLWYFPKLRQIFHNASAARIYLPTLTKTAACQAHERYENAEVFGSVSALEKDGADQSFFKKYENLYMTERARLKGTRGVITDEIPMARERGE